MKRYFIICTACFVIGFSLVGCTDSAPDKVVLAPEQTAVPAVGDSGEDLSVREVKQIKGTVMMYTRLLAEGYARLNMGELTRVAAERQATRVFHHMAALGEGGVKMLASLTRIEFDGVESLPDKVAEVRTREHWEYAYYTIATGELRHENDVSYQLAYTLEKTDQQWLIADVRIVESMEGTGKGDLSFMVRPDGRNHGSMPSSPEGGAGSNKD